MFSLFLSFFQKRIPEEEKEEESEEVILVRKEEKILENLKDEKVINHSKCCHYLFLFSFHEVEMKEKESMDLTHLKEVTVL